MMHGLVCAVKYLPSNGSIAAEESVGDNFIYPGFL